MWLATTKPQDVTFDSVDAGSPEENLRGLGSGEDHLRHRLPHSLQVCDMFMFGYRGNSIGYHRLSITSFGYLTRYGISMLHTLLTFIRRNIRKTTYIHMRKLLKSYAGFW